MTIRVRKRVRLWPLPIYLNATASGVSWSVQAGPWSWNSRSRRHRVDLPGPLSWEQPRRPVKRQRRSRTAPVSGVPSGRGPLLAIAVGAAGILAAVLGAPLVVGLAGGLLGAGGAAVRVRRWRRAQDARVAQPCTLTADQRRRAQAARHEPTCAAKSIRTCRCPGMATERAAAAKRAADARRKRKMSKSKGSTP